MMKIKLETRNFEMLQRFSAFSTKSEQISMKSADIATKFEKKLKLQTSLKLLAFLTLRTPIF